MLHALRLIVRFCWEAFLGFWLSELTFVFTIVIA